MPDPDPSLPLPADPMADALRELLIESADCIGAFRAALRAAGYPFREPNSTKRILAEIDLIVFPPPVNVKRDCQQRKAA